MEHAIHVWVGEIGVEFRSVGSDLGIVDISLIPKGLDLVLNLDETIPSGEGFLSCCL